MKPRVKLSEWFIYNHPVYGLLACGTVGAGHPRIEEGHHVVSSLIEEHRENEIETRNTIYEVGTDRLYTLNEYWENKFKNLGLPKNRLIGDPPAN